MAEDGMSIEKIICEIFKNRVEEIKNKIEIEEKNTNNENDELIESERKFKEALNNIPTALRQTRRNIIDKFIEYTVIVNKKNQKYFEKYYRQGIMDGIKLINDVLR